MKKVLRKIFLCVVAVMLVITAVACDKVDFKKTSYKTWGDVVENYGFIAETNNYYYFINGVGSYSANNTYGNPLKGSLMVADKNDLGKAQVAVPKLFVATDYNSGIFISGDYVYYGTPNTEKNGSGAIANTEMVFTKTKLDGTNSSTILTVNSLATEYRFVENDGVVYLVYATDNAIKCLNTKTGKNETVVEKNIKNKESLDAYKFALSGDLDDFTVIYTVTVYYGEYINDDTRITESYNKMYYFKAGEGSTLILNGSKTEDEKEDTTYGIDAITNGFVVFCKNVYGGSEVQYVLSTYNMEAVKIDNTANVGENNLIVSFDSVFTFDSDAKRIIKTTLVGEENQVRTVVAAGVSVSKLLFLDGDDIYYMNSDGFIARIELFNEEAKEVIVSSETASTTWYAPELLNGKIFYCAGEYIRYVDVTAEPTLNEEKDVYEMPESKLMGKKIASDEAADFKSAVANLSITTDDDGKPVSETIDKAQAIYDGLSGAAKEKVKDSLKTLKKYQAALEVSEKFYDLKDVVKYDLMEEGEKDTLKNKYLEVKQYLKGVKDLTEVREIVSNDLNCNYYDCQKLFEEKK